MISDTPGGAGPDGDGPDVTAVLEAVAVRLGWASLFGLMAAIREATAHYSLGTGTSWPARGGIVLLEDVNEEYRLDRMLTQLHRSGYERSPAAGSPDLIQAILAERLGDLAVPVIAWANVGHGGRFQTFPVGIAAELDAGTASLRLLDPPLRVTPG